MNIAEPILKLFKKSAVPQIEVGDVVRVHQKIVEGGKERIQVFEGIVIAMHNKTDLDATFTVRKIASGVGVERTYLLHSPRIVKIEFKRSSNVRRSKLYYLRNLTGKALKMKDRKVNKENWDEILMKAEEAQEPTAEDVAEAVEAAHEAEAMEASEETTTPETQEQVETSAPVEENKEEEQTTDETATTEQPVEAEPQPEEAASDSEAEGESDKPEA